GGTMTGARPRRRLRAPCWRVGEGPMHRVTVIQRLAGALLLLALASCGPSAATPAPQASTAAKPQAAASSDPVQQLTEPGRWEGGLLLVGSESTLNGTEGARRMAAQFNSRYGLNTNVQFTPGPAMPEVANKVVQEYQAGRRATVDVYLGPDTS